MSVRSMSRSILACSLALSACTDDGVRSPGDELGSESGESLGSESDAGSDSGGSSSDWLRQSQSAPSGRGTR